jgi:hypothetical protein
MFPTERGVSLRQTQEAPGNRLGAEASAMPGALRAVLPCGRQPISTQPGLQLGGVPGRALPQ